MIATADNTVKNIIELTPTIGASGEPLDVAVTPDGTVYVTKRADQHGLGD